jgi:hypothetical protein
MSSIIEGYNYDIFISYRQKKNDGGKGRKWEDYMTAGPQDCKTLYNAKY